MFRQLLFSNAKIAIIFMAVGALTGCLDEKKSDRKITFTEWCDLVYTTDDSKFLKVKINDEFLRNEIVDVWMKRVYISNAIALGYREDPYGQDAASAIDALRKEGLFGARMEGAGLALTLIKDPEEAGIQGFAPRFLSGRNARGEIEELRPWQMWSNSSLNKDSFCLYLGTSIYFDRIKVRTGPVQYEFMNPNVRLPKISG